jgi:hypothetical protein
VVSIFVVIGGYANYWWVNAPAQRATAPVAAEGERTERGDTDPGLEAR